jgi:hypothetical protein
VRHPRRLARLGAAAAGALALSVLPSSSANASFSPCGGYFCAWVGAQGDGYVYAHNSGDPDLTNDPRPGCQQSTWNDCFSSIQSRQNPGPYNPDFLAWVGTYNGGGQYLCVPLSGLFPDLSTVSRDSAHSWNDAISSIQANAGSC